MKQNREIVVGSVAALALIGLIIWLLSAKVASQVPAKHSAESASSTASVASTTPVAHTTAKTNTVTASAPKQSSANPLPVDPRDTITSWTVPVTASAAVKKHLQQDVLALSAQIGTGQHPDYDIFTQIAQDYELLSDGKSAYDFYIRAAKDEPTKGLTFSNIGNLMMKLGAYHTAHAAYAKSVTLSPSVELYWLSYLNFLAAHEAEAPSTATVFTAAKHATNSAPDVLIASANWEAAIGNVSAAIADWQAVRAVIGSDQQATIDAKIAELRKQQ